MFTSDGYNSYYQDLRYVTAFNYLGDVSTALKNDFPHESRQLGLRLAYRKLEIWTDYRFRKDRSALGLNPIAVAYNNPADFTAESLTRLAFRRKPGKNKLKYHLDASILLYDMDPNSLSRPVLQYADYWLTQTLILDLEEDTGFVNLNQRDSLFNVAQLQTSVGERYKYAQSTQIRIIQGLDLEINDKFNVSAGLGAWAEFGQAQVNYYPLPFRDTQGLLDCFESQGRSTISFISNNLATRLPPDANIYLFGSAAWSGEKIFARASLRVNSVPNVRFSPRFGITYRPIPSLSVFGNFTNDFSRISRSMANNTFYNLNTLFSQFPTFDDTPSHRRIITKSFEIGASLNLNKNSSFRTTFFSNRTDNLLRFNILENQITDFGERYTAVGYFNNQGDFMRLVGIKGQLRLNGIFGFDKIQILAGGIFYRERKSYRHTPVIIARGVADYPNFQGQGRISYRPSDRWYFGIEGIINSRYGSGRHSVGGDNNNNVTRSGAAVEPQIVFDTTGRYHLSRNFSFYYRISNIFNTHYGGISAVENPDALRYNVQPLRRVRVGINYDLN